MSGRTLVWPIGRPRNPLQRRGRGGSEEPPRDEEETHTEEVEGHVGIAEGAADVGEADGLNGRGEGIKFNSSGRKYISSRWTQRRGGVISSSGAHSTNGTICRMAKDGQTR